MKITRAQFSGMFGPTVGDQVRLADTELFIEVERDLIAERGGYGNEVKFGGGKVIRDGMAQSPLAMDADCLDLVITNATIIDAVQGIIKADIGIKNGRIAGLGHAGNPLLQDGIDMVIGSRLSSGKAEKGSLTPQQVFGNWLATFLIRHLYNYHFTDLGPFRAIRWKSLLALNMVDRNYGWTVEMQIKAAKQKLRCTEVGVRYRKRVGVSKVSGTIKGTILAGYKILYTIFKHLWTLTAKKRN